MTISNDAIEKFAKGADEVNETESDAIVTDETEEQTTPIAASNDDDDEIDINSFIANTSAGSEKSAIERYTDIITGNLGKMKTDAPEFFNSSTQEIIDEVMQFRKDLIVKEGLSPAEADEAAKNRAMHSSKSVYQKYYLEHPEIVNIEVSKDQVDKIEFTPEQQKKLNTTKKIELTIVDDIKLKTIKVKEADRKTKASIIYKNTCSLSHFSVPFHATKDFMTFKGASILRLTSATYGGFDSDLDRDNLTPIDLLTKKAQLLYDCFISSTTRSKLDEENNVIMTYDDFINWFRFEDVNTGLYCIYVASSTEMITSTFTCRSAACIANLPEAQKERGKPYQATYNTKGIINYDNAKDTNKEILDKILGARDNRTQMLAIQDEYGYAWRMQSSFTGNIYEFRTPTIADVLRVYESCIPDIDNLDDVEKANMAYSIWTGAIYIRTGEDENGESEYILIDDTDEINKFYNDIIESERYIIHNAIENKSYQPLFIINAKCPSCGTTHAIPISIENLVFIRAQSLEEATR